jgi:hypothetical protein
MLIIVLKKLILPIIDLKPAICNLKITKSTLMLLCPLVLKGGYKVHLVPDPKSTNIETSKNIRDIGKTQNLKLFKRGKLISGLPNIKGTIQFPKPPIIVGITIKKIINSA